MIRGRNQQGKMKNESPRPCTNFQVNFRNQHRVWKNLGIPQKLLGDKNSEPGNLSSEYHKDGKAQPIRLAGEG